MAAIAGCVTLGATLAMPAGGHAAPPSEEDLGRAALAEEFASAAVQAVNRPQVLPPMIRQSAALLNAACDEWKFEPRFPRLLTEACLQLNDVDGAIAAIERYRAIQLPEVQNDQFAQVQLIDLATRKAESLDDKLKYLKPLLGVASLPAPVKSHIAWVCSTLLAQKFDTRGAEAMLAQALQLNPVSPDALQSQYVAAQASGIPQRRAAALVALLKSNPAQPLVMGSLADELASVAQPDLAVTWYKRSFVLSQALGLGLDSGRYLNYAAALYAMDQSKSANDAAAMLLASQPSNIGAATIALLAARQAAKPAAGGGAPVDASVVQQAKDTALAALSAQMGTLHSVLHGVKGAAATQASTTQPLNLVGDIVADAPKVRDLQNGPNVAKQDAAFCKGYAEALTDLIFYYTYFDSQPANATKLLDALRSLRPADDLELTRLEGFAFLADGKPDEAKVKFSAIADHDALAKMGLLLMAPQNADTSGQAAKLVTDHPAGLLGAILLDGLHERGGKPAATADSTAVANEAAAFPEKLLDLLNGGTTENFYNVVADPPHVSVGYDEPALVRVTIKNVGDYDLSVGDQAAIRPDLWFDVKVEGGSNPFYPGVKYDRIAGPLVLKAHHLDQPGTEQVVRVDAGPLSEFLADRPTIALTLIFSVVTNPLGNHNSLGDQSSVGPGPGGYRKQFSAEMERRSAPVNTLQAVANLLDPALHGRIDQKIHALELLTNYDLVLQGKVARAQALLEAPAPAPNANGVGQDATAGGDGTGGLGAGGVGAPVVGVAPAAPPDPKELQAPIQYMQKLQIQFTGTIRSALRDPSPMVRYWAQAKLAQIADPGSREKTAQTMMQGKDWQERVLGLILANDVPRERGKALAEALKADPVPYVKDFADATIELAASSPTTRPTTAP